MTHLRAGASRLFLERKHTVAEQNAKYSEAAQALLLANLGYYGSEIPSELLAYLQRLLEYAYDDFAEMGIPLVPGTLRDDMDQMIHAAWMYRCGINGKGKHEMLRAIVRNRKVRNAICEGEEVAL